MHIVLSGHRIKAMECQNYLIKVTTQFKTEPHQKTSSLLYFSKRLLLWSVLENRNEVLHKQNAYHNIFNEKAKLQKRQTFQFATDKQNKQTGSYSVRGKQNIFYRDDWKLKPNSLKKPFQQTKEIHKRKPSVKSINRKYLRDGDA